MLNIIYDNIVFSLQKSGGISVYWKELIDRVQKKESINLKMLEHEDAKSNIFRKELDIENEKIGTLSDFPTLKIRRYLNPKLKCDEITIFHSSYYRVGIGKNIKNIVTVHDFTYEKKMNNLIGKIHIKQKKKALRMTDGIICISENTKKDLIELYPETKHKKIRVVYNGFSSKDYYPLDNVSMKNQVLFVGARKGYKNFDKAVEIVAKAKNVSLAIVGPPLTTEEKQKLDNKVNGKYQLYTHVSNMELNRLYNSSICLIYLSEYEGFGIPVLEAMSAGCPVIALNKSSIPEVAGDAALLFDCAEDQSIVDTVLKLQNNDEYRSQYIQLGLSNVKRFSWDKCFEEVYDFYEEVIKE